MATAACCTTPVFPFSALTSSSSSQERTSRSFKLRDDRIFRRSRPYRLLGSWISCPILRAQCRYISRSKSYGRMAKARASNLDIGAGNYENGSEESSQRNLNSGSNPKASLKSYISRSEFYGGMAKTRASNVDIGAGNYEDGSEESNQRNLNSRSNPKACLKSKEHLSGIQYPLSIAGVFLACSAVFSAIIFMKEDPSVIITRFAKSCFTAAFALIFISEIGDKTFFIAALLAMQYDKAMVLCGSVVALSLMTILSVVIGRIFQSVPSQFQTTVPIGEYAAVALLAFFGLKSIKNAWEIPSNVGKTHGASPEFGELVVAEELVKEEVPKNLKSPLEILWKSFSLVFFAEWGDRSMLATIALGAAQSPWGVACGAITGHLFATSLAILGGSFLASYISEKLVGYIGGVLFLVFAAATLSGVF